MTATGKRPILGTTVVALVGRPNAGKSTLYNAITGASARVGNFPGVTVDVLETEVLVDGAPMKLVDLPGIYSVDSHIDPQSDEGHARRYLDGLAERQQPHLVAQVLDSTQLMAGLRLTAELRRRGTPMVVLATQHDELLKQGAELDAEGLADALGVPVLRLSAREPGVRGRLLQFLADAIRQAAPPPHGALDVAAVARRVVKARATAGDQARR